MWCDFLGALFLLGATFCASRPVTSSSLPYFALGRPVNIDLKEADDDHPSSINVSYMYESVVPLRELPTMMKMLPVSNNGVQYVEMMVGQRSTRSRLNGHFGNHLRVHQELQRSVQFA
ncbi:uncharacterized protein LOC141633141 [Silene latifolia]|uniref:uncharacterized protein LOC141633141 n=1 Tax=Silene latifolia TaxID=37657 RepID=UPI003D77884C